MRCEIIAIGTELLLGQIVDANSAWLAEQLATLGIDSHFQTRVGDNLARIESTLRLALTRADIVITCGGLGPTQDDITRQAIANVMNVPLQRDPALLAKIEGIFHQRGRPFTTNNALQAELPAGAQAMPTIAGTAPGLICPIGTQRLYALPGVPWEMRAMFSADVLTDLQRLRGTETTILSHTLSCLGPGESVIAAQLAPRLQALEAAGNPTIAFLASDGAGVRVRITAKAGNADEARRMLEKEALEVRTILGDCIFSENTGNGESPLPEAVVLRLLEERAQTLGVAESLTGGVISARLSGIPGASRVFRGGIVSYASDIKFEWLNVPPGPVISETVAIQMAQAARHLLHTDVGLAATGVAGPEPQENLRPGTACIAVALENRVSARTLHLVGRPREQVRTLTATLLFDMLRRELRDLPL